MAAGLGIGLTGCYDGHGGAGSGADGTGDGDGGTADDGDGDGDDGDGGEGPDGDGDDGDDAPAACADDPGGPASAPLARLTRYELGNTISDLLGADVYAGVASAVGSVPPDIGVEHLDRFSQAIAFEHVAGYHTVAEAVGEYLETDATARTSVASCIDDDPGIDCITGFLDDFGARAFRRPLTAGERDDLVGLYDAAETPPAGLRQVVSALLQSPAFVFRVEEGTDFVDGQSEQVALSSHEIAARLSYSLWGRPPDAALLALADADALDEATIADEVERMLQDDAARTHFEHFARQWLAVNNPPSLSTTPDHLSDGLDVSELDGPIDAEVGAIVQRVVFDDEGGWATLMTTDLVVPDHPTLAALYGVTQGGGAVPSGDPERAGLVTRAAFLVGEAGVEQPVKRGVSIYRGLLCGEIAPPDELDVPEDAFDLPPVGPDTTTRERYEVTTAPPACAGCHGPLNSNGFALSNFDGLGRARTHERVFAEDGTLLGEPPIDAAVELAVDGSLVSVDGGAELAAALADSYEARRCLAKRWLEYTVARHATAQDTCAIAEQADVAANDDAGLRSMIGWFPTQPSFTVRQWEQD
ncbi:MAG: DUF1592 domain-containing protein [Myxococcota bacterium]